MKNSLVTVLVASALSLSIVIRQKTQAQNANPQAKDTVTTTIAEAAGAKTDKPAASGFGPASRDGSPTFVTEIPAGYRDWKLISVAHEEGNLNDIRAILGNDIAVEAYREGKLPFPEGAIIARVAWSYVPSDENNKVFAGVLKRDVQQSFVAGPPTNGVQFMVKDSKQYASTGGWGFAHFNDGKAADEAVLRTCFPCHQASKSRDLVFTRYSP